MSDSNLIENQIIDSFLSEDLNFYNNLFQNEPEEDNKVDLISSTIDSLAEIENNNEQTFDLFHHVESEYFTTFTTESMWPI